MTRRQHAGRDGDEVAGSISTVVLVAAIVVPASGCATADRTAMPVTVVAVLRNAR